MTTRTPVPEPRVIPPATSVPGRARPAAPLRREGPAKLTGTALYTDDIVVPGAWYGATIRSTDAHATFDALELDPGFDWSKVVVVTADDIPGENVVSSIEADQPILVPVGGEIQHHAEPLALIAAPDRATLREARRRAMLGPPDCRPSSTPTRPTTCSRATSSNAATPTRRSPPPT
jgi:xanthine dehydrogenase molybdopterin-binding subunit B